MSIFFYRFAYKRKQSECDEKSAEQFFEQFAARLDRKNEQPTQVAIAGTRKKSRLFFFTKPFFTCNSKDAAPDGKNATRFANCAVICPTFRQRTRSGKVSVPPPIPIPARIPPATPASMRYKKLIFHLFAQNRRFYCQFRVYKMPILSKNHFEPCKQHQCVKDERHYVRRQFFEKTRPYNAAYRDAQNGG